MSGPQEKPKFGLLAGWGRYPIAVAQALVAQGYAVYGLGMKGHADPALRQWCRDYREEGVARIGAHIRYFQGHGVRLATMAGKIHKSLIFKRGYLLTHRPDWTCIRRYYPHFVAASKDRKDDTLLQTLVDTYADQGITFAPATDYAPQLLVEPGLLSGRRLSRAQRKDIEFGWNLAKEMGRLDIGQTVAVKGQAVLAVEAVEGTDQCIRRAGALCEAGGFTVVKVAKPQQDMRFDVPTIGLGTIETLAQAGGRVLAIEAEKTILLDRSETIALARRHRIALVAQRGDPIRGSAAA